MVFVFWKVCAGERFVGCDVRCYILFLLLLYIHIHILLYYILYIRILILLYYTLLFLSSVLSFTFPPSLIYLLFSYFHHPHLFIPSQSVSPYSIHLIYPSIPIFNPPSVPVYKRNPQSNLSFVSQSFSPFHSSIFSVQY